MTKETQERGQKNKTRGNGEGTIFNEGNRWRGIITVGLKPDGSLNRVYFSGKTKQEVTRKKKELEASIQNGTYVEKTNITYAAYLKLWLKKKKNKVSNKNFDTLEYHVYEHIIPSIGHVKIQKLKKPMIDDMYTEKYDSGRLDGKGGLSPSTIKHLHETIRMSLNEAVIDGYIMKNPSLNCNINFKKIKDKKKFYTAEEQLKIIGAINTESTTELLILTDMLTGLRKGEITALTWDDIDFENLSIHVNKAITQFKNRDDEGNNYVREIKEPKTKSSNRYVPITEELAVLLKKHKQRMLQQNLKAGKSSKEYNIVFQSTNGTHLMQANVSRSWRNVLKRAEVDPISFHGIRHSYATRLAENNVHPKVTQSIMGHSTISTTLDIYSHVSNTMVDSSREILTKLFKLDSNYLLTPDNNSFKNHDTIRDIFIPYEVK
ncbi:site-specific integrase [Gudongella sp. DL1XJH-153]|uniref:site-specific integrase n=1 Tax=Gudongella sp. DL1XJH-153 TaxID=3409804 RepID=UPI003BB61766